MKKNVPATLARSTGGATFSFASNHGIEHAFEALARDLSAQYLLSFVPQNQDAGLHQLTLTTTNPALHLRYRRTYWSTAK